MTIIKRKKVIFPNKNTAISMRIILITILFIILFNGSLMRAASATHRDWKEGDILTYDLTLKYENELISPNGTISSKTSYENTANSKVNISFIDDESGFYRITYLQKDPFKMKRDNTGRFDASFVGNLLAYSHLNGLVKVIVENNQRHIVARDPLSIIYLLGDFEFDNSIPYIIDPDWKAVKNQFLDAWVETFQLSPNPTDSPYTLGDLWKDAPSFKFMGKSSLKEARQALNDEPHEWTLEYDLSGFIEAQIFAYIDDNPEYKYQPYKTFTGQIKIEYTKGGTLKRISLSSYEEINSLDGGTIKTVLSYDLRLDQGGLFPGGKVDFSPISVSFGLGLLASITLVVRKNKRRETK